MNKPTKLIITFVTAALIGGQGYAEDYPPKVSENPYTPCCDNPGPEIETDSADVPWAAVGVIAAIVLMATLSNRRQAEPLDTPRPTVRPEGCLTKHGVHTFACD